ncbi:MAG: HRDC domain-containing protein, partial [Pseudomonadota bacterium]
EQILAFAAARKGQSGIVYCGTRAKTETIAQALRREGHAACHYHGGMEAEDRRIVEARFQREDGLIVVATVAFGMGVDKPDIRWVAHADLPKSIEAYYQEIGRAGRDGAPAETLTLFGAADIALRRQQIDEGLAPVERKAADHGRLNALLGLAEALSCRRTKLLEYFGDAPAACNNCDLCDKPAEVADGTTPVRMALSAMLRTEEFYGAGHLIDILLGIRTERVRQKGHDTRPTFGVGTAWNKAQWNAIFRQMMGHDLIRPDPARYGALRMTERARPILRDAEKIDLRFDTIRAAKGRPEAKSLVSDEAAPLLSALKGKRRQLAEAAKVPAYVIFPDRTLIEMAEARPQTLDDMARISGVGAKKLERYGCDFLAVIAGDALPMHPTRRKLAGSEEGAIFDGLMEAQNALKHGPEGTLKPVSCTHSTLRQIAERKPDTLDDMERIQGMGPQKTERFGEAFLEVLRAS